jgi:hypothetical protein
MLAVDDRHVTFSEYNSSAGLTKPGEVGDFFGTEHGKNKHLVPSLKQLNLSICTG